MANATNQYTIFASSETIIGDINSSFSARVVNIKVWQREDAWEKDTAISALHAAFTQQRDT